MDCADARLGTLLDGNSGFVQRIQLSLAMGFFEVDAGVVLEQPIHVVHLADAEGGSFAYRHHCNRGGCKCDSGRGVYRFGGCTLFHQCGDGAFVADGAKVDHYKIQRESAAAYHFQTLESELGQMLCLVIMRSR